jgi:protoporphyrinogen oxidase
MSKKQIVILGAGITGLVTAYYFSKSKNFEITLIEKKKNIGGTAFAFKYKDFTLDYGPHKLYSELPGIIDEIKRVVPLLKIKKKNSIYLKNSFYNFPLQLSQIATKMPFTAFNSGLDIFSKSLNKLPDDSYENFLLNRFGKTLYNLSFRDYAYKVWTSNPQGLDKELAIKRVAISNIFELIKSVLLKKNKKISAEYFAYPKYGTMEFLESLIKKIKENGGKILLDSEISEIKIKSNNVEYIKIKNKKIKPDYLISTIYLDSLLNIISDSKTNTKAIKDFSSKLCYQNLNIIYFIVNKPRILNDCWIFFPEKKFLFHRISEQKAFSEYTSPKDKSVLMVETTRDITPLSLKKIISQLESVGILKKSDIEEHFVKSSERVYPVYKKGFMNYLTPVLDYVNKIKNLYSIGRPGLFNYNNMDQCWDMAQKTFEHISTNKTKEDWKTTLKYFDNYRIVD